jgi:hypothetical protein
MNTVNDIHCHLLTILTLYYIPTAATQPVTPATNKGIYRMVKHIFDNRARRSATLFILTRVMNNWTCFLSLIVNNNAFHYLAVPIGNNFSLFGALIAISDISLTFKRCIHISLSYIGTTTAWGQITTSKTTNAVECIQLVVLL